ncbi:hypothetical protein C8Q79DRAFT_673518 [Trametes meyenii]|nr:hypothetical protein C8Q79DRAFT_673518 [Trametes meyenii]
MQFVEGTVAGLPTPTAEGLLYQAAAAETTPLLAAHKAGPEDVKPLRYRDILRAIDTHIQAFASDSLMQYFAEVDVTPFSGIRAWFIKILSFSSNVCQKRMLTVDGGGAWLTYIRPGQDTKPHRLIQLIVSGLNRITAREAVKRREEVFETIGGMVKSTFGENAHNMYEIQGLATAPELQGRGYGKALVNSVITMAEADGHDIWVTTSDARPFYETLGFCVLQTRLVGMNNPAWKREPVSVYLMQRTSIKASHNPI